MKLGVAYNIFNGDELLYDSLKRLSKHADYIVLTYQKISNVGNLADDYLEENLANLDKALYDEIIEFKPDKKKHPKQNETDKRQLGLKHARKNKCTHFMTIDCDEFYDDEQFIKAKEIIKNNKFGSTACELRNYFHSSNFQMIEKKRYVAFITEINFWTKFKLSKKLPVSVDPSRVCYNKRFHLFNENELIMHHMSYVRKDINSLKSKLENSPNHKAFDDILEDYLFYYDNWHSGKPALNPHDFIINRNIKPNTKLIKNPIDISISFKKT